MEDLNIVEQLRILQKEMERLKYKDDPYIFSRFSYHWVHCKDVLRPIMNLNAKIDTIDSLNRVIGFLKEPHKGNGPVYPSEKESAYQLPHRDATKMLEALIQELDGLINSKGSAPLVWPLELTLEQMKETKGHVFGVKENI